MAPINVTLSTTLVMKSLVGLPGLIPGMKPPFFFIFSAISLGLMIIDV